VCSPVPLGGSTCRPRKVTAAPDFRKLPRYHTDAGVGSEGADWQEICARPGAGERRPRQASSLGMSRETKQACFACRVS